MKLEIKDEENFFSAYTVTDNKGFTVPMHERYRDKWNKIILAVNLHEELIEALKMEIWATVNTEREAQALGKPRLSERLQIMRNLLAKAENKTK